MDLDRDEITEWFYSVQGRVIGPFAPPQLRARIHPLLQKNEEVYLWKYGQGDWVNARELPSDSPLRLPPRPVTSGVEVPLAEAKVTQNVSFHRDHSAASADVVMPTVAESRPIPHLESHRNEPSRFNLDPFLRYWNFALFLFVVALLVTKYFVNGDVLGIRTTASVAERDDKLWQELSGLRKSNGDKKEVAFRIASQQLSNSRPVLLGALNPQVESSLQASSVQVMVYPENGKSALKAFRRWILSVPLVDGYFTVGPLSVNGAPLPQGTYTLLAQVKKRYLGALRFQVGAPLGAKKAVTYTDVPTQQNLIRELLQITEN